jgi:hypothetical protein
MDTSHFHSRLRLHYAVGVSHSIRRVPCIDLQISWVETCTNFNRNFNILNGVLMVFNERQMQLVAFSSIIGNF